MEHYPHRTVTVLQVLKPFDKHSLRWNFDGKIPSAEFHEPDYPYLNRTLQADAVIQCPDLAVTAESDVFVTYRPENNPYHDLGVYNATVIYGNVNNGERSLAASWPPPLGLRFKVDFGAGSEAEACAGCPVGVLAYNGFVFIGPLEYDLRLGDASLPDPLVAFGPHCGYINPELAPIIGQYISPGEAFTHVHCLENWDSAARTFTIEANSSEGWGYTYYWQGVEPGDLPQPAGTPPFNVQVGAADATFPGTLALLAVHTPAITISDTLRETFVITATSAISTGVQAANFSFALAPGYALDEAGGRRRLRHLPAAGGALKGVVQK